MQIRIREIMSEKGITSVSLADLIGVSKVTVSNLINNKTMPSIETLERVAKALDVPLWQLFVSPSDVTGKDELTALIDHKGKMYHANSVEELKNIVDQICIQSE